MRRPEPVTDPSKAVRCRDCLHYQLVPQSDGTRKPTCSGAMHWAVPTPDTFCSWGVTEEMREQQRRKVDEQIERADAGVREVCREWAKRGKEASDD